MAEWWKKIAKVIGFEVEELSSDNEALDHDVVKEPAYVTKPKKNNIVSIHSHNIKGKLVLLKPDKYDSVQEIADYLSNNTAVIVNLDETDRNVATRILDFLSGAVYALKGQMQKVNTNVFLITPNNYQVLDPEHKNKIKISDKFMSEGRR